MSDMQQQQHLTSIPQQNLKTCANGKSGKNKSLIVCNSNDEENKQENIRGATIDKDVNVQGIIIDTSNYLSLME